MRMVSQVPQAGTDRAPRGVDACKQQEPQRIADIFVPQRLSFKVCLKKKGNEILPLGEPPRGACGSLP